MMRLDKYICQTTGLSRAQAKKLIGQKRISIDGKIISDAKSKVDSESQVYLDGQLLKLIGYRYLILHKPVNTICSTQNEVYPSALNLVIDSEQSSENPFGDLHFAGRLDVDTTGLVLISDDGQWTHRVTSPRKKCKKVYRVKTSNEIDDNQIEQLTNGLLLNDEERITLKAEVELINHKEMLLTIYEGRYHQVKRMLAAVGNHVESLHREQIGEITLDGLKEGQWRALTESEVRLFD